jgi:hypothetical protein
MRRALLATACLALALAAPAVAHASNAGVGEYTENPPNGNGGLGGGGHGGGGLGPAPTVPATGAPVAPATGTTQTTPRANFSSLRCKSLGTCRHGQSKKSGGSGHSSGGSGNLIDAVGDSSSGGLGPLLPIILIASAVAGILILFTRHRMHGSARP